MYRAPGTNSIWVTLAMMSWNWEGGLIQPIIEAAPEPPALGPWTLDPTRSAFSSNPVGSDTTELPEFSSTYDNEMN
jgi:hypothetical protein